MRHSRREIWRTRLQRCPRCGKTWLVPGAKEGDRHICKSCGQPFLIERQRTNVRAARQEEGFRTRRVETGRNGVGD